jgi:hypothetical protein
MEKFHIGPDYLQRKQKQQFLSHQGTYDDFVPNSGFGHEKSQGLCGSNQDDSTHNYKPSDQNPMETLMMKESVAKLDHLKNDSFKIILQTKPYEQASFKPIPQFGNLQSDIKQQLGLD